MRWVEIAAPLAEEQDVSTPIRPKPPIWTQLVRALDAANAKAARRKAAEEHPAPPSPSFVRMVKDALK